ncbi:MAG: Co2+/Mg2+ efflux protein ApaG [Pseudomonas sp.]|jgi:ApaG protein|nr:Co2+/Mg2+ efflux protein ApaG [Pseudomonas sp.]
MPDSQNQIDVSVTSRYLPEQSQAEHNRFAFAYTVTLHNRGQQAAKLLSRHWLITDGDGRVQEVRGPGVVGQQPRLEPGAQYTYSSGTLMTTRVGFMQGSYQMQTDDGATFDAPIAPFRLVVPGALH